MSGPLTGSRVLDLTRYQAGPVCSLLLADMGAEVIKIEDLYGEDGRRGGHVPGPYGESLYFQTHNRNKRGAVLNLRESEGKNVFRELVSISDAVVENFRPGVMAKLGIDYRSMQRVNPTIVMTSISGFGQYGPYAKRGAHDMILHAMAGTMSLNGWPDKPPVRVGVSMADYSGGIFGAMATSAALYRRAVTGEGQHVDVAMYDAMLFQLDWHPMKYTLDHILPKRTGNRFPDVGANGAYQCKDGMVYFACSGDVRWTRLCQMMGHLEYAEDPRFRTNPQRWKNHDEVDRIIESWTHTRSVYEVAQLAEEHKVPCGPVMEMPQVLQDPQVKARRMFEEIEHPIAGKLVYPGVVPKFSRTPGGIERAAPLLGEHNQYVYAEMLGYSDNRVEELEQGEVIWAKQPGVIRE